MKKSYFIGSSLLVLAILAGHTARAQASYRPGYVVTLAGDTVRGQVQEVSARRNRVLCRFRPTPGGPVTDYAPASLQGYGIARGATYQVRAVPPADATLGAAAPQQQFLEVVVPGPAQLYSSRDQPGRTRYFVAVGGPAARLRELAERREKAFANGLEAYETRSLYRDTLAAALRACPAVQPQLPRLPFQQAALVRVITQYNACVGSPGAARATKAGPAASIVGLSVLAGYQGGRTALYNPGFASQPAKQHTGPVVGLALGLTLPHTRRTLSARLGAEYSYESYGQAPTYNQACLTLPVQVRYTLKRSQGVRPFIEAGALYAVLIQATSDYSAQVQPSQFGFVAGVGASLPALGQHRLSVLLRVSGSESILTAPKLSASKAGLAAILSLDFGNS